MSAVVKTHKNSLHAFVHQLGLLHQSLLQFGEELVSFVHFTSQFYGHIR